MKSQSQFLTHRDSTALSTTFLTAQEAAKLAGMLAIAAEDLERVSGGAAALASSLKCCCCHHGSMT